MAERQIIDLENQLRQACALLHRGIRDGDQRAELLLERFPELAEHADLAVELIYTEYVAREQQGQPPRPEEYFERFPRWQRELAEQFQVHRSLHDKSASSHGSLPTLPGVIGAYELLEVIEQTDVSIVYRARHRELDRLVAIKLLLPESGPEDTQRYQAEATLVARLSHAHILPIYEVGDYQGRGYLVLEYAAGGTLAKRLQGEPQPPRAAAELAETLAGAVEHMHRQGVIHRDLKPANVLLSGPVPKIADFSLAIRSDEPAPTGIAGTPSYMAPEQVRGEVIVAAVDIYALGAILYELLTGRPPFRGDTPLNTMRQVLEQEPVPPRALQPGVLADLETICLKCLAKEPGRRYESAQALADDLRRFLAGEPIQARPTGRLERAWKWSRRHPTGAALVAVSVVAALTVSLGSLWYNVRLQQAAGTEAGLKADALKQLDVTRRSLYTIQLAQVEEVYRTDPGRALEMLEDEAACPPELRDFAWGMFFTLCRQDLRTLRGPGGAIAALALTDNRVAAAAGKSIMVWNDHGEVVDRFASETDCRALRFAANGQLITNGHRSSRDFPGPVHAWALAPNGEQAVLAGSEGSLRIINTATRMVTAERKPDGSLPFTALAWSPDGKTIAVSGTRDCTVHLCRADTLELVATVKGHLKQARVVAFSPDGKLLATAGDDREVKLWQVPTLAPAGQFKGHTGIVRQLAFTPDGATLVSGSDDSTVRVWSLRPAPANERAESTRKIICLAYTPDGSALFAGRDDGSIVYHDPQSLKVKSVHACHDDAVLCLAIAPNGSVLASGGDNGEIRLWDREMKLLARLTGHERRVRAVTISPDSRLAASAGEDGTVRIWDMQAKRQTTLLNNKLGSVRSVGFSPDGLTLAAGNDNGSVSLWDVKTGQERQRFSASERLLLISQYSPDGKTLVTGGLDYLVGLWDMPGSERRFRLTGHTEYVFAAAFTPDGRTLATGSGNRFTDIPGEVKLWDAATGQARATLAGQTGPVAFSPDGRTLATVDHYTSIKLWRSALPAR